MLGVYVHVQYKINDKVYNHAHSIKNTGQTNAQLIVPIKTVSAVDTPLVLKIIKINIQLSGVHSYNYSM